MATIHRRIDSDDFSFDDKRRSFDEIKRQKKIRRIKQLPLVSTTVYRHSDRASIVKKWCSIIHFGHRVMQPLKQRRMAPSQGNHQTQLSQSVSINRNVFDSGSISFPSRSAVACIAVWFVGGKMMRRALMFSIVTPHYWMPCRHTICVCCCWH